MSRGYPDYHNNAGQISVSLMDNSDMFGVGFGIQRVDSRGRVFLPDNFRDGLGNYIKSASVGASLPEVNLEGSLISTGCLLLDSGAGATNKISQINKYFYLGEPNRVGIEISYTYGASFGELNLTSQYYYATLQYQLWVRINSITRTLDIRTPSGFETVYALPAVFANSNYTTLKVVVDFRTLKYDRLILGSTQIDLRSHLLFESGSSVAGLANLALWSKSVNAGANNFRVGYLIYTIDEP